MNRKKSIRDYESGNYGLHWFVASSSGAIEAVNAVYIYLSTAIYFLFISLLLYINMRKGISSKQF